MINAIGSSNAGNTIAGDLTGSARPANIEQAAQEFEAIFLRSMLQQMRKAADVLAADDDPFNSKQQRMMRDFYDDKMASELASQRSTGIAQMIINQLSPQVATPLKNEADAAA